VRGGGGGRCRSGPPVLGLARHWARCRGCRRRSLPGTGTQAGRRRRHRHQPVPLLPAASQCCCCCSASSRTGRRAHVPGMQRPACSSRHACAKDAAGELRRGPPRVVPGPIAARPPARTPAILTRCADARAPREEGARPRSQTRLLSQPQRRGQQRERGGRGGSCLRSSPPNALLTCAVAAERGHGCRLCLASLRCATTHALSSAVNARLPGDDECGSQKRGARGGAGAFAATAVHRAAQQPLAHGLAHSRL
jgi:hypothetical protein